jgi:hypothetical protein
MRDDTQLTQEERYQIEALLKMERKEGEINSPVKILGMAIHHAVC